MLAMPSFLADMVQPSPRREHLLRNLLGRFVFVARLAQLDEPGVLGEAAGVEVERDAVPLADGADLAGVFHGDRLAAAGVVGDGEHHQRNALAADARDELFQRGDVHVAFERMQERGLAAFGDDQIDGFGAGELDVGARGVEVRVVGNDVALFAHARRRGCARRRGPGAWE